LSRRRWAFMKASELRELSDEQLNDRLRELREELFNLRFQYATRQLTNTARIREVRRDIARVLTQQHDAALAGGGS
jgi:large subunit ribosomal protein L29